jgi:hypothetical protein
MPSLDSGLFASGLLHPSCIHISLPRKQGLQTRMTFLNLQFLGEVAEFRKLTFGFVTSVCQLETTRPPLDRFSWNLTFQIFFSENLSWKFKFCKNLTRITGRPMYLCMCVVCVCVCVWCVCVYVYVCVVCACMCVCGVCVYVYVCGVCVCVYVCVVCVYVCVWCVCVCVYVCVWCVCVCVCMYVCVCVCVRPVWFSEQPPRVAAV